jgi:hypothetical protein
MRYCYDFATVGRFMVGDLSAKVRGEMVSFVKRELLTQRWMRAQSKLDVAAATFDRPDHGSMGAYDAWPAVTVDASCVMCGTEASCFAFDPKIPASIYVKKPERNSRSVASGQRQLQQSLETVIESCVTRGNHSFRRDAGSGLPHQGQCLIWTKLHPPSRTRMFAHTPRETARKV